jgi:hypothetical protein
MAGRILAVFLVFGIAHTALVLDTSSVPRVRGWTENVKISAEKIKILKTLNITFLWCKIA